MVQGFGIGMLLKRFSEFSVLILAVLISGCAFVLMVGSLRAYLHGTTLSHATSLRQAYHTNCFV